MPLFPRFPQENGSPDQYLATLVDRRIIELRTARAEYLERRAVARARYARALVTKQKAAASGSGAGAAAQASTLDPATQYWLYRGQAHTERKAARAKHSMVGGGDDCVVTSGGCGCGCGRMAGCVSAWIAVMMIPRANQPSSHSCRIPHHPLNALSPPSSSPLCLVRPRPPLQKLSAGIDPFDTDSEDEAERSAAFARVAELKARIARALEDGDNGSSKKEEGVTPRQLRDAQFAADYWEEDDGDSPAAQKKRKSRGSGSGSDNEDDKDKAAAPQRSAKKERRWVRVSIGVGCSDGIGAGVCAPLPQVLPVLMLVSRASTAPIRCASSSSPLSIRYFYYPAGAPTAATAPPKWKNAMIWRATRRRRRRGSTRVRKGAAACLHISVLASITDGVRMHTMVDALTIISRLLPIPSPVLEWRSMISGKNEPCFAYLRVATHP